MEDRFHRISSTAFQAVVFMHISVQFIDADISGLPVQAVDVLGNDAPELILFFEFIQVPVRGIGPRVRVEEVFPVEIKEDLGLKVE